MISNIYITVQDNIISYIYTTLYYINITKNFDGSCYKYSKKVKTQHKCETPFRDWKGNNEKIKKSGK